MHDKKEGPGWCHGRWQLRDRADAAEGDDRGSRIEARAGDLKIV